jgi:N-methylhydantoinase B
MVLRVDDNLSLSDSNGSTYVTCAHCNHQVAPLGSNFYDGLAFHEGSPAEAGPQIWLDASVYIDKSVVFRQWYCPNCFTADKTEVVPSDHVSELDRDISAPAR